ncbi:hypothetical protein TVAG_324070 [Trichomonas vaginalis G3]|uniref:DUF3447 domain-containing protein n=1 Tax=Trichomonas vaginalis (strain ATCC PRA-98 / G3) TaxID=412133 RepID=A2F4A9_TRIV3|nr:ankyrin repeat and SOCS box-containing protein 4 family [Trichomonas vaginalis G3]EAY00288.1 hypothetical protein TVAG_324070 [Trichomonas vaginalis G3]KAI5492710.1 ankyrin repeat and SOCS box-containing protein 4 family [Trichomonas vaginalis G3]|eukprot:XP_001313217.1 hypothetical protein [Trichomonas vaginalis G3]
MSDQDIHPNKFSEFRSICKYYIDLYNALYRLKTEKEEDLNSIYKMIKTELIESKKSPPKKIIEDIFDIIPYNNRYTKSYFELVKHIYDDYNVTGNKRYINVSEFLFYKEYGIKLNKFHDFEKINSENLYIHTENTIYRAIMYNDLENFIAFTEREEFDKNQRLNSKLYPDYYRGYSLLELCCYHGAVDCFKFLRTKFNSEITNICLEFAFLGGNPEIMSECLKYQKPNGYCMIYAIISHNIDFVTFLINEYNKKIKLEDCTKYNNLESFFVYFDQTNDVNNCFINSLKFNIPSLCGYFLSHGANINEKIIYGKTALHLAAGNNSKEAAEFLKSHGANISERDNLGQTALHIAAVFNSKETAELLISHGANINEKDNEGKTALHEAAGNNSKEAAELLISHGANINEKNDKGFTALQNAAAWNCKETAELLISHGANINEKDKYGRTALHWAACYNRKEIVALLISNGANINEKDNHGETARLVAAGKGHKETVALLISHGSNINEKDKYGRTAEVFSDNAELLHESQ